MDASQRENDMGQFLAHAGQMPRTLSNIQNSLQLSDLSLHAFSAAGLHN